MPDSQLDPRQSDDAGRNYGSRMGSGGIAQWKTYFRPCAIRIALIDAYSRAAMRHAEIVASLVPAGVDAVKFQTILDQAVIARGECEQARVMLEAHILEHGCKT